MGFDLQENEVQRGAEESFCFSRFSEQWFILVSVCLGGEGLASSVFYFCSGRGVRFHDRTAKEGLPEARDGRESA